MTNTMDMLQEFINNNYSEEYKKFKENYIQTKQTEKEKKRLLEKELEDRYNQHLQEYTKEYTNLKSQFHSFFIEPKYFIMSNILLDSFIYNITKVIISCNMQPITFHTANKIPPETDVTYWAYNPMLYYNHFMELIKQINEDTTLKKSFLFIYGSVPDTDKFFKQFTHVENYQRLQFENDVLLFMLNACRYMNTRYNAAQKIVNYYKLCTENPSYRLCRTIKLREYHEMNNELSSRFY